MTFLIIFFWYNYDIGGSRWKTHADVFLESETHGGEDVAVFARGPHEGLFTGVYEQSQLPHLMAYAGCFGEFAAEMPHCNGATARTAPPLVAALLAALCLLLRNCCIV
jgi:alkaline phosphatase